MLVLLVAGATAAVGQGHSKVVVKQLNLKSDGTAWLSGLPVTRRDITYISTNKIDREVLSALQAGDYVGVYSEHDGLDVSHTGLLVHGNDGFMLRHASSRNRVRRVVDDDLLEPVDVADECVRNVRRHAVRQLQTLGVRAGGERVEHVRNYRCLF